jgi:uncharacterized protein (TIGR02757 family)
MPAPPSNGVARARGPGPEFPAHLNRLYEGFPFDRSLADDPLSCVRPFARDPRAAEIAGIIAATLAVGNTTAIRGAFGRVAEMAGDDFPGLVRGTTPANYSRRLGGFRHRWIRGDQIGYLALRLRRLYETYPSLEDLYLAGSGGDPGGFAGGLDALARGLRGPAGRGDPEPPPGYAALFPSPVEKPSTACKRMTLFVRWMVRDRYPDLGLWTRVPTGELRIPLDYHVQWIAYNTGLTHRRSRSWAAVEEITETLRRIDPMDPVKYDFVLCHTGISGDCPKQRQIEICGPCSLRPDCRLWRGREAG